jgi:transglutaminase-like putative cysteine protease
VWAEFFIENLGWIPVDPTLGQTTPGNPGKPDYYFGSMDNQRVILNKGFNIQLDPAGPDGFIAPFLQVPLWWYWGSSGDGNSVSLERTSWKVTPIP